MGWWAGPKALRLTGGVPLVESLSSVARDASGALSSCRSKKRCSLDAAAAHERSCAAADEHGGRLSPPVPAGLAVKFESVTQDDIKLNHVQHHQRVARRVHGPHLARQWHVWTVGQN